MVPGIGLSEIVAESIRRLRNIQRANGFGTDVRRVSEIRTLPQSDNNDVPYIGVKVFDLDPVIRLGGSQMEVDVEVELHLITGGSTLEMAKDNMHRLWDDVIVAMMKDQRFTTEDGRPLTKSVTLDACRTPGVEDIGIEGKQYMIMGFRAVYERSWKYREAD